MGRIAVSQAAKLTKAEPEVQRGLVEKVLAGAKLTEASRQASRARRASSIVIWLAR
jgi:hypothetical protein